MASSKRSRTAGGRLTTVEERSESYAKARLKWVSNDEPLPFLYESTGQITRFTNGRGPKPRSREIFAFHRPETFDAWARAPRSFRSGLAELPPLNSTGLRECQVYALANLEASLKADRPQALVQMATGAGKTFTAVTQVYQLLNHAGPCRVLFAVNTRAGRAEYSRSEKLQTVDGAPTRARNSSAATRQASTCSG